MSSGYRCEHLDEDNNRIIFNNEDNYFNIVCVFRCLFIVFLNIEL